MSTSADGSASTTDFEAFFRAEHPRLLPVAVALTGSLDSANDVVQEALIRTLRAWPTVSTLDRPGAWTRRVLLNLCVDVHRRRGRERRALGLSPGPGFADMPDPPTASLWAAVRALPDLQRACVALYYVDDLSVADVATTLEVSEGTVKTSLSRARSTLATTSRAEEH